MMNPASTTPQLPNDDTGRGIARLTAALLGLQFVGMWGAFFVLAPAIDWPASLDKPASVVLPLIAAKSGPVFVGYLAYLMHALLLIPLAVLTRSVLAMPALVGGIAQSFGLLAGFAKSLGIIRWLVLMPGLAIAWTAPATTPGSREAIAVVFDAFNAYAGGVGELLGVGLFAGLWTLLIAAVLIRNGSQILGWSGVIAGALLLATLGTVFGLDSPLLLTGSGIAWQFWTLALAIAIARRRQPTTE